MRNLAGALLGALLLWPLAASAEPPQDREREAVGVVVVRLLDSAGEQVHFERGTGVVLTPDGRALTAAHLFDAEDAYSICTAAAGAPSGRRCLIEFYLRGDTRRLAYAHIASERSATHDYILLQLPDANDAINRPTWPYAFVGQTTPRASDALFAAGYPGEEALQPGVPSVLSVAPGVMSAGSAQACTEGDGWGISNAMSGQTAPGFSGGPVFDARRRVVGLILGPTCSADLQGVTNTRVLTLASIPNFCAQARCLYGLPGYIAAYDGANARDWRDRMEGGRAAADEYMYEWRLSALATQLTWAMPCVTFNAPQLNQRLRADYELGGELAAVLYFVSTTCTPTILPGAEAERLRARLFALADAGYEPAMFVASEALVSRFQSRVVTSPDGNYNFTALERADLQRAAGYIDRAAASGWAASLYQQFEFCRLRLADCTPTQAGLERAAAAGQWNARRDLAFALLKGRTNSAAAQRYNFAIPQDRARAVQLLMENVQPVYGVSTQPVLFFDNISAGFLSYLYGGGRVGGEQLVTPNLQAALQLETSCYGTGVDLRDPTHVQCWFFGNVARYNLGGGQGRASSRPIFEAMRVQGAPPFATLAYNIMTWIEATPNTQRIECDFDGDLFLSPPAQPPQFQPGVAYCYYPHPGSQ